MVICLSHANYVESCQIGNEDYLAISKILEQDGQITFTNYADIGGDVTVSFQELRRRIRFRPNNDLAMLKTYSKDVNILYGLLEEMEGFM